MALRLPSCRRWSAVPAWLAVLLLGRALAQPPKCAPRSAAVTPTCDAAFGGNWTGIASSGQPLFDRYSLTALSGSRHFNATMLQGSGWATGYGSLGADGSVSIALNTGLVLSGVAAPDCQRIAFNNSSLWQRYVTPPTKLRVHLAPHTHNDVGWRETYLEYYQGKNNSDYGQNVSQILGSVIPALLANPQRRFSYVEQAYFSIFFDAQTPAMQDAIRGLVSEGRLVFLSGGWSMADEANPTYADMLDNLALGQRYIATAFGIAALPTLAWQIDPFGHSGFEGKLYGAPAAAGVIASALGGYMGVMWGREPQDFKTASCASRSLERVWQPSPSLGGKAATWQAVFAGFYYCSPAEVERCDNEYGPTNATCGAVWGARDAPRLLVDLDAYYAPSTRGKNVLIMMGDDFTYENGAAYFDYLDALIAALNADGRYEAFYSTPAQYAAAQLATVPSFPRIDGDAFPYNDDEAGHNMWSGFYSSRPSFKAYVRESGAYMRAARQLQALVGGVADLGPSNPLYVLERALGVAQHHDAIAGTAQQRVNDDYVRMIEAGRVRAFDSIVSSLASASRYAAHPFELCPLLNATLCPALESGRPVVVLAFNALDTVQSAAPIRLSVGFPAGTASYAVVDDSGAPVTAQLVPRSARDDALRTLYGGAAVATQWLCFTAQLPAVGYAAFFVTPMSSAAAAHSTHASRVVAVPAAGNASITNGRLTLTVSADTGFLGGYADAATGVSLALTQAWMSYIGFSGAAPLNGSSQASGAYIFRPTRTEPEPLYAAPATVTLVAGPVVNAFESVYGYVTQETRLWTGAGDVEIEWTVGPVDAMHEVITRYEAHVPTSGDWATDSNCRESQPRRRDWRRNWNVTLSEHVAGNYFPVGCLTRTASADGRITLAVAPDRSEGGTSLADGQLELLVHRRLLHDDGRGVGEPLNEPGVDGKGLIVRGRHWLVAAAAPAQYKAIQQRALAGPTAGLVTAVAPLDDGVTPAEWLLNYTGSASLLTAALPPNVHLATVHSHDASTLLLRLAHLYETGEDAALSSNATVSVRDLLRVGRRTVVGAVDMTLPGSQPLAAVPQRTYADDDGGTYTVPVMPQPPAGPALDVTLGPMEVRTLLLLLE